MSTVAVNEITDEVGTGSPAFTNGLAQSDIAGALNATGTAHFLAPGQIQKVAFLILKASLLLFSARRNL